LTPERSLCRNPRAAIRAAERIPTPMTTQIVDVTLLNEVVGAIVELMADGKRRDAEEATLWLYEELGALRYPEEMNPDMHAELAKQRAAALELLGLSEPAA
jgi:hypothetical protein